MTNEQTAHSYYVCSTPSSNRTRLLMMSKAGKRNMDTSGPTISQLQIRAHIQTGTDIVFPIAASHTVEHPWQDRAGVLPKCGYNNTTPPVSHPLRKFVGCEENVLWADIWGNICFAWRSINGQTRCLEHLGSRPRSCAYDVNVILIA